MKHILLIICFLAASVAPVLAFTGMDLSQQCSSAPESLGDTFCKTFVTAFTLGLGAVQNQAYAEHKTTMTCIPTGEGGATMDQIRLIVEKFMRDNPQILNKPADVIMFVAINKAFPCPVSNQ